MGCGSPWPSSGWQGRLLPGGSSSDSGWPRLGAACGLAPPHPQGLQWPNTLDCNKRTSVDTWPEWPAWAGAESHRAGRTPGEGPTFLCTVEKVESEFEFDLDAPLVTEESPEDLLRPQELSAWLLEGSQDHREDHTGLGQLKKQESGPEGRDQLHHCLWACGGPGCPAPPPALPHASWED